MVALTQIRWKQENRRQRAEYSAAAMDTYSNNQIREGSANLVCAPNIDPVEGWLELDRKPSLFESLLSSCRRLTSLNSVSSSLATELLGIWIGKTPGYLGRRIDLQLRNLSPKSSLHSTADATLISDLFSINSR
ncbi:hypothetical protein H3V53_03345 [Paraburkholderia bengalensis]|uniref:Uncharacterized protein n=1 Tax=Paraburkholderia bengalensis TaxID=2747562 RepID=A0ABU8ILP0_9BURK